jgi:hypothetical protein
MLCSIFMLVVGFRELKFFSIWNFDLFFRIPNLEFSIIFESIVSLD